MMRIRMMRLLIVSLVVVMVGVIGVAVSAQTGDVDIPLDRVHRGDPGELFLEAEISADNQIGWTCLVTLDRRNNSSTHEGTNLIIESGTNTVAFMNIESVAFDDASRIFVIDGDIFVYTQIGEDGVSSMGFLLEFECTPPPDETTTTTTNLDPPPSTGTIPPDDTTTTEPPPVGGVPTGGGACADGTCLAVVWVPWALGFGLLFLVLSGITLWRLLRRNPWRGFN